MIKHTTFAAMVATVALVAGVGVGVGLSGCGPAVPAKPTWEADVYPLLVARCIRCHDSPSRSDPASGRVGAINFNFPTLVAAASVTGILQSMGPKVVKGILADSIAKTRMPPPPAEALADWEIQIIDNWSKEVPLQ